MAGDLKEPTPQPGRVIPPERRADIQRRVFAIIRPGGGFFGGMGMRGGMGGQVAEPGTYAVKLTAGGKTLTGKIAVRLDPMLPDK